MMMSSAETISLIGIERTGETRDAKLLVDDMIVQFERGATYVVEGLRSQMDKLACLEQKFEQAVTKDEQDRHWARVLNRSSHIAKVIQTAGHTDFRRMKEQRSRISQLSLVGDAVFHGLPWELLGLAESPWFANAPMVRRRLGHRVFEPHPSGDEELRVLFLTARPSVQDVPPRAVIEPVLREMERGAPLFPQISVLRTGMFKDLAERLRKQRNAGTPAHIVHLDLHGTINAKGEPFLMFERAPDFKQGDRWVGGDAVSATKLARVLNDAEVQVLVLNACRSASGGDAENFAFHLAKHDIPAVIGMRRRIEVTAASEFVAELYQKLCSTPSAAMPVTSAVRQARTTTRDRHGIESTYPSLFVTRTPSLPLRPTTGEQFETKQLQIARAEVLRPMRPMIGRWLDERVMRGQVFSRRVGSDEYGVAPGRPGPLQVVGWRGVGKTTLVRSLASHWIEADLSSNALWLDCKQAPLKSILEQAAEPEADPEELVLRFLEGGRSFNKTESNLIIVDHAERIEAGPFGTRLWKELTALEAHDNNVIVVGTHLEWCGPYIHGRTRRFTLRELDDASAVILLRSRVVEEHVQELAELSGRVPNALEAIAEKYRLEEFATAINALELLEGDSTTESEAQLAMDLVTELFTFEIQDKLEQKKLHRFAWLDGAPWLEADDLNALMGDGWSLERTKDLCREGLLTEIPLDSATGESLYAPHPLLSWVGQVVGLNLCSNDFGDAPEDRERFAGKKHTYWGAEVRI